MTSTMLERAMRLQEEAEGLMARAEAINLPKDIKKDFENYKKMLDLLVKNTKKKVSGR